MTKFSFRSSAMIAFFAVSSFFGAFSAQAHSGVKAKAAQTVLILTVTSDATPELLCQLKLLLSEAGDIIGFRYGDGKTPEQTYSLEDIKDRIVLYKESRFGITKDINYMSADRFDSKKGGFVELTLLREFKSIFSFDYRIARLSMSRRADGQWELAFDDVGKRFVTNRMFFKGYKVDGEYVGTDRIFFYQGEQALGSIGTQDLRED